MKLNFLSIFFQNPEDFLQSINTSIKSGKSNKVNKGADNTIIKFDSEKTFSNLFTLNKLQILRAISQIKPGSVYKLATYLGREPQHVLKDCRLLESLKFIKLDEVNSNGRSALKPTLVFEYDVIKIYTQAFTQPFPVSEKAEKLLNQEIVEAI